LKRNGNTNYAYTLALYTSKVCSTASLKYNSFLLLQMNLQDQFISYLINLQDEATSTVTKAALNELIDEALDGDILEIIENSANYLTQLNIPEAEKLKIFIRNVDQRIIQIKEQSKIETLFSNLQSLVPAASSASKMAMAKLTELTKQILVTGSLENNQLTKLLAI
jgi:hypothetical protein